MRNPKAPAPPRYSQPDGYEVRGRAPASAPAPRGAPDSIEPESFEDDDEDQGATRPALVDEAKKALEIAEARRKSLAPIVEKDSPTEALDPQGFQSALAQLQRQRQNAAPAPAPPPSSRPNPRPVSIRPPEADVPDLRDLASSVRRSMHSIPPPTNTGPPPPVATDDPKVISALLGGGPPLTSSTAPMGTPALGLKPGTGVPLAPQRTPAPMAVVGGSGGLRLQTDRPGSIPPPPGPQMKTTPSATAASRPPGAMPSRPPGALASRPPGAMMTPAGAKQYDFARWSSPDISEMPNDGSPVTFQVYTAKDVASGRGPMRSIPAFEPPDKKASIGTKIALAVVGVIVVLVTAAAVILVSTDDPKKDPSVPSPSDSSSATLDTAPAPAPTPSVIVIGDQPAVLPPAPEDSAPPPPKPRSKRPPKEPAPSTEPRVEPAAPKNGSGVAPPPNPYGSPGK